MRKKLNGFFGYITNLKTSIRYGLIKSLSNTFVREDPNSILGSGFIGCSNEIHKISITMGGRLIFHDHDIGELNSEIALTSMGAEANDGCAEFLRSWRKIGFSSKGPSLLNACKNRARSIHSDRGTSQKRKLTAIQKNLLGKAIGKFRGCWYNNPYLRSVDMVDRFDLDNKYFEKSYRRKNINDVRIGHDWKNVFLLCGGTVKGISDPRPLFVCKLLAKLGNGYEALIVRRGRGNYVYYSIGVIKKPSGEWKVTRWIK
jgi:hypothetical protein